MIEARLMLRFMVHSELGRGCGSLQMREKTFGRPRRVGHLIIGGSGAKGA